MSVCSAQLVTQIKSFKLSDMANTVKENRTEKTFTEIRQL